QVHSILISTVNPCKLGPAWIQNAQRGLQVAQATGNALNAQEKWQQGQALEAAGQSDAAKKLYFQAAEEWYTAGHTALSTGQRTCFVAGTPVLVPPEREETSVYEEGTEALWDATGLLTAGFVLMVTFMSWQYLDHRPGRSQGQTPDDLPTDD